MTDSSLFLSHFKVEYLVKTRSFTPDPWALLVNRKEKSRPGFNCYGNSIRHSRSNRECLVMVNCIIKKFSLYTQKHSNIIDIKMFCAGHDAKKGEKEH